MNSAKISFGGSKSFIEPAAFLILTAFAGSNRLIRYFPGATKGGLLLAGGISGAACCAHDYKHQGEDLSFFKKVSFIAISTVVSCCTTGLLKGRVSLSIKNNLKTSSIFVCFSLAKHLISVSYLTPQPPRPNPAQTFQRLIKISDKIGLPDTLPEAVHTAYTLITVSEVSHVEKMGSLFLGSFEAVESLRDDYHPEDPFFGIPPADSGFPLVRAYPIDLQETMGKIYREKKKATAERLRIEGVVTVGYSRESPETFLPERIEKICMKNISEMSHEEFMTGFQENFPTIFEGVKRNLAAGKNVLIHCNSGEHRSPIVTIALVMRLFNVSKEEAHNWVRSKRPIILPDSGVKLQNLNAALDWVNENRAKFPGFLDQ